jgi:predicted DCC family thiol-disulfide oxidoreductase YuxK
MKLADPIRRGWVLYDGECRLCTGTVALFGPMLRRRHFDLAPLQTPWVRERLGLKAGEMPDEMKLLTEDGKLHGGAGALLEIARTIWWAWPLYVLGQIPGGTILFRKIYRRIAMNRHCFAGACAVPKTAGRHHTVRTFFEIP